jgi:hypothetical protein
MQKIVILVRDRRFTNGATIKVGRHSDSDLRLFSEKISRHHLEVSIESDGRILLRDLNSLNGTYVNGQRINFDSLDHPDSDELCLCSPTGYQLSFAPLVRSDDELAQGVTRKFELIHRN